MERENIARAAKGDANAFEALMGAYETENLRAVPADDGQSPRRRGRGAGGHAAAYGARSASIGLRARFPRGSTG